MSYSKRYNNRFVLSGHRGGNPKLTENTKEMFKWTASKLTEVNNIGWELMIETDVHFTKDEVLVCFHDDTVDRLTNKNGSISNYTFDELKALKLQEKNKEPGTICSVNELFTIAKDVYFSIDIKPEGQTGLKARKELISLAKKHNCEKRLNIASFHYEIEEECLNDTQRKYWISASEKTTKRTSVSYLFSKKIIPALKDVKVNQLDVPVSHPLVRFYTYSWINYCHKRGATTFLWESEKRPLTDKLLLTSYIQGVDGLHVDDIERCISLLSHINIKA